MVAKKNQGNVEKEIVYEGEIMKLVSVIIPIYNVEEYIEECLVSVLKQTLTDIEVVCVNDGTPDNSMEIVERYAKEDDRIVIVNKENGGLSSARNAGIKAANGEYVYFMDSDDYILEDTLEYLYREAKENDLDTIFFDADSFFECEELAKKHQSYVEYYHRKSIYEEAVSGQELFAKMIEHGEFRPSACLQMNRRSLLKQHNITFYPGIMHEDNLFTLQISLYAKKAKHVSKPFYMRRIRDDSIMTNRNLVRSCEGYFVSLLNFYPEIEKEVSDDRVYSAYMKQLRVMQNNAVNIMSKFPKETADAVKIGTKEEAILFQLIVKNYGDTLREKNGIIARQKSELNKIKKSGSYKLAKKIGLFPRGYRALKKRGLKYCFDKVLYKAIPSLAQKGTKISIVMPVYNCEKYLRPCLDSLCKQTLKAIEIICVDDGSTDTSMDILQEFKEKDKRIHILTQNHMGAGMARNKGMKVAKGSFLLFLDSDDYFDKNMCEKAYYQALRYNAEVVLFGAKRIDMQTGQQQKMGWILRSEELPKGRAFSGEEISDRIFQITSNASWSKLYRKKYLESKGLEFQNIKHTNDAYMTRCAIAMAKRMVVLDESLLTYRYNDGTNTQSVKYREPLEFFKAFKAIKEKLESEGLYETYRKSYRNWAVTECLFNYNTMKTEEAKEIIKSKLLGGGLKELDIHNMDQTDFVSDDLYGKYRTFVSIE